MKYSLIALALIVVIGGGWWFMHQTPESAELVAQGTSEQQTQTSAPDGATKVPNGSYAVDTTQSSVQWAVGKPLIEGYLNSGTIGLSEGTIVVNEPSASGSFIIDMNTIRVGSTPKKPGKETALEGHLKGKDFFDVEKFPTGTFAITTVTPNADSDTTHQYTVAGNLTLKGVTKPVTFPAAIYLKDGMLHADATLGINRTEWGIIYGSGTFFDNMANNAIEDTIHLTLTVIGKVK